MKKQIIYLINIVAILFFVNTTRSQTLIPGSLPGELSVSPTGAAVYTIPIELPEGRGGMTPQLALVYNSQSGNGVMGKGWSISGWSFIGRVAESIYYDGAPGSVDFQDDGFELDGNRLFLINQMTSEYRPEIDGGMKISFLNTGTKETGDWYWKVQTKNGLTMYYGSTDHSRQNNGGLTLTIRWHLSKVIDLLGNYIEYQYEKTESTGEVYLKKIIYSKNDLGDNNQYYSVNFNYAPFADAKYNTTTFISSSTNAYVYSVKKRLESISVNYNETTLSTYNLTYLMGLFSDQYLRYITFESGGKSFKPTFFDWDNSGGIDLINDDLIPIADYFNTNYENAITGDFNGDGVTDIAYGTGSGINMLITNIGQASSHYLFSGDPGKMMVGDIDGDGKDELFVESRGSNKKISIIRHTQNGTIWINEIDEQLSFVADFTGDGYFDLVTYKDGYHYIRIGHQYISAFLTDRKYLVGLTHMNYHLGNFVGTSKTGIVGIEGNLLTNYLINQTSANTFTAGSTFTYTLPSGCEYIDVGDFNGDGKDDLIIGRSNNTFVHYSYGSGFSAENQMTNLPGNWWTQNYVLSDFNYDGITDIAVVYDFYFFHNKFNYTIFYKNQGINSGFSFQNTEVTAPIVPFSTKLKIKYILSGNFQGDGHNNIYTAIEFFNSLYPISTGGFFIENLQTTESRITKFKNGNSATEKITYAIYKRNLNEILPIDVIYPVSVSKFPFLIVDKIYGGANGETLLNSYTFENLLMHLTGKGTLGFIKSTSFNFVDNTKVETDFRIKRVYGKFFYPYASTIKVTALSNSAVLSNTTNIIETKQTQAAIEPLIFLPVITKSFTKKWDLDGTYKGIDMVKQDLWNMDDYGNPLMKEVFNDEYKTTPDESDWKWQSQYWTFFDHVTDNGKWHSRLMGTVVKAKSYELDEWKFESTENKYYGNGLLEFIKSIAGYDQFSSPLVSKTNLEYDIYGNITKKTLSAPNDTQLPNRVTDYEYSSIYNGRFLTKQTVIGPPDVSTVYEYYADKGMLKEKKELYNASTNTSPIVTKYEYDSFGRLQKTTHPDQTMSFTEMTFAGTSGGEIPAGAVVKIKSYTKTLNNQTWGTATGYLNKYGNQLRSIGQNLQGTNIYIDKTYDNYGRLVNETDPYYAGNPTSLTTTYAYDELGRVSSLTASNGTIMKTTYKGRAVKIKNMTSKVWTEKTINAIGLVDLIVDTLGTLNSADRINNNYDGLGRLINTVAFGNTSSFEYDAAGNQSKLIDPNAGTIIYSYNAYGELVTQKDACNNEYKMVYDKLGRIVSKTLISRGSEITTYTYLDYPSANGFTQLNYVARNNGTTIAYSFDNLGRIKTKSETIDGNNFTFAYTYNSNTGMLETNEYPSGYKLKYLYDSRGNQHEVRTGDAANTLLWKANSENQRGQLLQATLGNGAITDYGWDTYGYPQMNKVSKGSTILQNLTFSFNSVTGNLNTRTDVKRNILETFDYDNLLKNRLIYWSATGGTAKTMAYKANGNIEKKTDVSRALDGYKYESTKPHAVTKVVYPTTDFSSASNLQAIEYTAFNKVESIHQAITTPFSGAYDLSLTYNPNNERVKTVLLTQLGMKTPLITTKHFLDNYEVEQMLPSTQKQLHYLHAGDGLFAIMVKQGSNETLYYIHKDYLGSITAISNSTGSLVESLSYDPWGRRRNPANYSDYNVTSTMFDRGYTGHEHLPQFGLINMNGRVYDPFLARFLSPDPFVQAPDYSQNYNRYSYAFNNPLKYTDPDGEWVHLVVGAIIGGVANWAMNGAEFNAKGLGFFGVGAVAGALAAGTGAGFGTLAAGSGSFGFMSATGLSTVGFGAGFASGAGAGLTSGLVTGTGNSLLLGNGFQQSLQNGVETGLWSSLGGGLLGGSLSGIRALSGGKDFLSGNGSGGKFGKIPSPSTVGINDKGFQSSLNSNGLRNQIDNLIEPELKPGIYGRVQGISEIRTMDAAKGSAAILEETAVHGNSLKSLKATWGYKLYSNDDTFLKNGITSKLIPETRYTKVFMSDKYIVPFKQFPNRLEAYQWEYQQNLIKRGLLNLNMH